MAQLQMSDALAVAGAVGAVLVAQVAMRRFQSSGDATGSPESAEMKRCGVRGAGAAKRTATLMRRAVRSRLTAILNLPDADLGNAEGAPHKSMLYTRTGDAGESSLYNAERRPKDDLVFEALGAVDELNAALGVAAERCREADNGLHDLLRDIQSRLIDSGASIGTPRTTTTSDRKLKRSEFNGKHVFRLEKVTDALDAELPPLRTFILPGGGIAAATLHVARTACRRAERSTVPLVRLGQTEESVGRYLNRLSDMLFAAARYAAQFEGREEVAYRKGD